MIILYPHDSLNTSKGVVQNKELNFCTIAEIKCELKKKTNVIDVQRISIKQDQIINTNTCLNIQQTNTTSRNKN